MPDFAKAALAWTLPWDADWVTACAFVGGSRRLAAGNNRGDILVWDLPEKPGGDAPKPVLKLSGHTNVVSRLAASPDGLTLISASYDHTVRYWNPSAPTAGTETVPLNAVRIADLTRRGGKGPAPLSATVGVVKESRVLGEHAEWVVNLTLTADGKAMISGDDAGKVVVWDVATGTQKKTWQVKGWAYALALSPDAKRACVGERYTLVFDNGRHAGLKVWDADKGEVVKDLSADFPKMHLSAAAYTADGKWLVVGRGGEADANGGGKLTVLDATTGKKLRDLSPPHMYGITDLMLHPDGKHLASAGRDTVVRIWDPASGKMVAELGKPRGGQFKDWVHAVAFSPDGHWMAAADMDGAVQVWHLG